MTLLELLQKWSELEPDRCTVGVIDDCVQVFLGKNGWRIFHLNEVLSEAVVQVAVQEAILSHGLPFRLENYGSGYVALLLHPDTFDVQYQANYAKAAIALLEAYLQWLEHERGVDPCQS